MHFDQCHPLQNALKYRIIEVRCGSVHSILSYLGLCSQGSRKCRLSGPLLWDTNGTELPWGTLVFEFLLLQWGEAWRETPGQGRNEPKEPSWRRWLLRVGLWNPRIIPYPWSASQFLCTPPWAIGLGPSRPRIRHKECRGKMASSISEGQIPPQSIPGLTAGREHCHFLTFPKIVIWHHRRGGLNGSEQTEAF